MGEAVKVRQDMNIPNRSYPSAYKPGTHWAVDEAWVILDRLPPDLLPDDYRFLLAGQIAGVLMKHAKRR